MTLSTFFYLSLAAWRLASLIANEDGPWMMFRRLRKRAEQLCNKYRFCREFGIHELVTCEWCNSVWIGAGLTVLYLWLGEVAAIVLEQLKIVLTSITKSRGHNLSTFSIGNYLCFLGMTLLFATVMPFLAFFGRSIGCSLTSNSTTSNTVSLAWSVFLPGKRNSPERTKAFSTFWIVRQTVASLMPYDWAI